ncbi:MAG: hypothetical protein ABJD07_12815 [Gemmatimonadaceae bacterium]
MSKRDGNQAGAQKHAEGSQGEKTRNRQREIAQSGPSEESDAERNATTADEPAGHHRLIEKREQHDDGEKESEKTRIEREAR